MLANGLDPLTVSPRLGHTKASTTLNIYAHTVPGLQEKAAAIMDEITTLVSLSAELTEPQLHPVAPRPKKWKILTLNQKTEYFVPEID